MRNWWRLIIWAALVVAALWFLWAVRSVLPPFVAAVLFAAFMEPTIKGLRARGYSRPAAVATVFFALFLVLALLIIALGPPLVRQLNTFQQRIPIYIEQLQGIADNAVPTNAELKKQEKTLTALGLPTTREGFVEQHIQPLLDTAQNHVTEFVRSLLSHLSAVAAWIVMLLITPILTFNLMLIYDDMRRRTLRLIPLSIRGASLDLFEDIGDVFTNYLKGLLVASLMFAIGCSIILWFLGVPGALLLGFLAGVLYMAPWIGPAMTIAIAVLVALASESVGLSPFIPIGGKTAQVIGIIVGYLAFNFSFDTFIYPRIAGKAVGLNFFMSFFVITAGAALFGIVGMIFAYPVAGSVKVVLDRIVGAVVEDRPKRKVRLPKIPLRFRAVS